MSTTQYESIVQNLEYIVSAARSGQVRQQEMREALCMTLGWLCQHVPLKEPLPRGYSLLCQIKKDPNGFTRRHIQLLKTATVQNGGRGVWLDTANMDSVDLRDIQTFAEDIASGLLAEIFAFLKESRPAAPDLKDTNAHARKR